MTRRPALTPRLLSIAACIAATTALVACGSSSDSTSTTSAVGNTAGQSGGAAARPTSASSGGSDAKALANATVSTADSKDLGPILVDSAGRTLYLFEADSSGDSTCNGKCAAVWPPYVTKGKPKVAGDADSGLLGTTQRDDGTTQVTYNGDPLYYYVDDKAPGDTAGNGLDQFGAEWYALTPKGENAEGNEDSSGSSSSDDSGSDDSSSSGGGGGYSGGY